MPKSEIHPTWFKETPVLWDGKPLCLIGSTKKELQVDDFVFLRPHQSEFVFLQFGNILTLRNGKVSGAFSLLSQI